MRIDLKKFFCGDTTRQELDYSFSMGAVEVDGVYPFTSSIQVKGLLKSFADSIELTAELAFDFSMPCNRCAEEHFTKQLHRVSHTLVRSLNEENNDSFILLEGDELDLDELFYSDVILSLPVKYLCNEDCKGLCATCGTNQNFASCHCNKSQIDPRFEALKALLDS